MQDLDTLGGNWSDAHDVSLNIRVMVGNSGIVTQGGALSLDHPNEDEGSERGLF